MKTCIKCGEQIVDAAVVCYRCNERQIAPDPVKPDTGEIKVKEQKSNEVNVTAITCSIIVLLGSTTWFLLKLHNSIKIMESYGLWNPAPPLFSSGGSFIYALSGGIGRFIGAAIYGFPFLFITMIVGYILCIIFIPWNIKAKKIRMIVLLFFLIIPPALTFLIAYSLMN